MGKKRIIAACCITFVVTVVGTIGFMSLFNVGIGDKAFVSLTEYQKMKTAATRYAELDSLYDFLEANYYEDLNEEDLALGMYKGLFEGTGDPYTKYLTKEERESQEKYFSGEFDGVGVSMNASEEGYIQIISVMDDSPAKKAGVKDGDIIVAVDDVRYSGEELSQAAEALRGPKGTKVKMTVSRDGEIMHFELKRAPIEDVSVYSNVIENNIGYIRITSFVANTSELFEEELASLEKKNVSGLVIDIRSNGGGLVNESVEIADMLMNEGVVVYAEDGKGEKTYYKTKDGRTPLKYVVLVNKGTASASEILAAGIQCNEEGTVLGETTFGKGIIQKSWRLTNGDGAEITIAQYFTSNGEVIHKKGITPDVVSELKEEDIENGVVVNDRQLQKAIEVLNK
ncbi:MAG: S41 family peptidase [Clostridiales bacterium]|nr:S41 family peptidase [Clostridiales bacterium]